MRIFACVAAFVALVTAVMATPESEIEALLQYVASLDGASFVRNGDAHTPAEAESHLRLKWTKQKSDIVTAEDFIRLCATKSTMSGKPYTIKFKDGHEEESGSVLTKELAVIRSQSTTNSVVATNPTPESVNVMTHP